MPDEGHLARDSHPDHDRSHQFRNAAEGRPSSGAHPNLADLSELIGKTREPEGIVRMLFAEIEKRLPAGRVERKKSMLVPKEDDIAMIALRLKGQKG